MSGLSAEAEALLAEFDRAAFTAPGSYANIVFAAHLGEALAAAHARGVAEERARWTVEALAIALHKSDGYRAVPWKRCQVKADHRKQATAILAAMAPTSPPEGEP